MKVLVPAVAVHQGMESVTDMVKYHISPASGRPNICRAKVKCPIGGESDHYASKEEARAAYEKKMSQDLGNVSTTTRKATRLSLEEELKKATPDNIDGKLAELYYKEAQAQAQVAAARSALERDRKYQERYPQGHPNWSTYEKSIARLQDRIVEQEAVAEVAAKEATPYHAEFQRRGGWQRAFLVSNGNGHVHKNMNCSTCFPTTQYAWMTDYSGKNEDEIVDAAGERACTVCYPSAPASSLNKPTKMFTEDEKRQQEAREEKARVKAAKEAKAKAAGIWAEDGGPLKIKGRGRYDEEVKTERSAQIAAVDALVQQKLYKKWDAEERDYNTSVKEYYQAHVDVIVPALARKRNVSEADVMKDLEARAEAKWKREYQR